MGIPKIIRKRNNEKGFTLVEVIVAIGILSVGILAAASMQISSLRGNSYAEEVTNGTVLAGEQLERLYALDYDAADMADTDTDGNAGLGDTGVNADHTVTQGIYTVCWNVAEGVTVGNTKTIRMIVTWTYGNDERNVTVQFIKARSS